MRKRPINKFWIILLAIATTVAVLLSVMNFFSATSAPLPDLAGIIASPFRAGYTAIATWFNDLQNYYKDTTDLQAENAALRQQIAKNEETIREAEAAVEENKRLHELLKLTHLSVSDVSKAVGYDNPLHFSRAYKNIYGISPRGWRNQNKIMK